MKKSSMNKKGFPILYEKAVGECKSKSKSAPDGSFHPLRMSRCIRNNFFKECKKQEGRVGECRSATKNRKMRQSRLDQVKRQRGVHVSTYLLLNNATLPCGAKDRIKGASCLPSMSGHGRLSIDDYVGGVLQGWPLKEMDVKNVVDRERCLLRMALFKDQRKDSIRMYWNRAKYYDVGKKKTIELKPEFFTMKEKDWVEKYLNKDKNGIGYEIYDTVKSDRLKELMKPIKSRPPPKNKNKNKKKKKQKTRNDLANSPGFVSPEIFYKRRK